MSISTNDPGLNLTEVFYYDSINQKIRFQFFYSILSLEPAKGIDLVLDSEAQMITVQSDDDCKQTSFIQSLMPVSLFFQMFNALTNYHGVEIDSSTQQVLHKFKVR